MGMGREGMMIGIADFDVVLVLIANVLLNPRRIWKNECILAIFLMRSIFFDLHFCFEQSSIHSNILRILKLNADLPRFTLGILHVSMSGKSVEAVVRRAQQDSNAKALQWYDDSRKGKTAKQAKFLEIRKALYDAVNSNPKNPINRKEFCQAMEKINMSKPSAKLLFADVASGGRTISFAKLDGYLDRTATKYAIQKFKAARGRDRYVDLKEFINFMHREGMPRSRAKRIYATVDANMDGHLTLVEFRDWASELLKLQAIEQEFLDKANWPTSVRSRQSVAPAKQKTSTKSELKHTPKAKKKETPKPDVTALNQKLSNLETKKGIKWYDDSRAGRTKKQAEYEALRKAIMNSFDTNSSGKIGKKEFVAALAAMKPPMGKKNALRLYNDITNGFGTISMAKLDGYLDKTAVSLAIQKYKKMRGSDRYIDPKEFVAYMEDEGLSSRKARTLFRKVDSNHDGRIRLKEFRDWASDNLKVKVIEQQFMDF
eukprot:jgi/Bigna1/87256/estExt_fgenesh1_pg.C_180100